MQKTAIHFDEVITECRDLFSKKLQDYGAAWRVLRPSSVTDQIFIKVNRIRTLQMTNVRMVNDGDREEFIAIVNYSIIGLIQLNLLNSGIGIAESWGNSPKELEDILELYDFHASESKNIMLHKNHDYGEAWKDMRISSITDLIFQKVLRLKQIENNSGKTIISEGLEANYYDILNYAIFCLIKTDN